MAVLAITVVVEVVGVVEGWNAGAVVPHLTGDPHLLIGAIAGMPNRNLTDSERLLVFLCF